LYTGPQKEALGERRDALRKGFLVNSA